MPNKPQQPDRAMLMDQLNWDDVTSQNLNFFKSIGVECIRVATPRTLGNGEDHTEEFTRMRRVRKWPIGWKVSPVIGTPAAPMARTALIQFSICFSRPSRP